MNSLTDQIQQLKILLETTYADLSDISVKNFNKKMPPIRNKINQIVLKRKELIQQYKKKDLLQYDKKLFNLTKQIQEKFDNVIEWYKTETLEIAQKLVQIRNRKKIANYVR
ncbi:MAG: hypothetical protein IH852_02190 [Bacteroidetes bacterium]|nr:hypothetical protein [Bacteroidota bacterium]